MLSLNMLIYGLLAPIAGTLGDCWKPRRVMAIGITILGLATASCAFAQELWHFYLLFGILVPVGAAFSGWPLLAPALVNWFVKRRGLAIGLGYMGGGLSFTYGMFVEFAISQLGWRYAYFVLAGMLVALLLPLYLFFFHYRPENRGLKAYGAAELPTARESTDAVVYPVSRDWTLGGVVRTYQLWLMVLSNFLYWGIGYYLVLAHQVKFAEDVGYNSMFAASIFALFGIFVVMGQLSTFISDWIGRKETVTLATVLSVGGLVVLLLVRDTSQPWLLYVYAGCFGYGGGLFSPTLVVALADLFHGRHFGAIAGLLVTGMGLGGAIGPWLGGYIYDIWGNYSSAFVLCIACLGLACISFWIAVPRSATRLWAKT